VFAGGLGLHEAAQSGGFDGDQDFVRPATGSSKSAYSGGLSKLRTMAAFMGFSWNGAGWACSRLIVSVGKLSDTAGR